MMVKYKLRKLITVFLTVPRKNITEALMIKITDFHGWRTTSVLCLLIG